MTTMAIALVGDGVELRRTLMGEFRGAADAVREAAGTADASLVRAVHDYRKGLRRARALLRLVAGELPKADRREIRRALTDARRALGSTRDHAVANDVLGDIAGDDERALAKLVLDSAAASALSTAEIKQLLAEGAARTAAQVELLDTALPANVEWRTLVDGVRTTYAQARRARRAAKRSRHAFHLWRRRCKELGIQLDVLAQIAGPSAGSTIEPLREHIVSATSDLGDTVDLLMARDFVRIHCEAIGVNAAETLTHALEAQLDEKIREGRRAGRDAFRKKPRALARKLAKAAKLDVTPVASPPPVRAEEFAMT
jgi:hypothetical protein